MRSARLLALLCIVVGCVDLTRPQHIVRGLEDASGDEAGAIDARPLGDASADRVDVVADLGTGAEDGVTVDLDGGDADADEAEVPPALVNGRPCDRADECASGFCAQGVCCNAACGEVCVACNQSSSAGTCTPVPTGQDPKESCTQALAASCGQDGTCDGLGACRRYPQNAECAAGGCSNGTERAASTCDGKGTCRPGASTACTSGVCSGNTCGAPCSATVPCQSGFTCKAGRCALKSALAAMCAVDDECASGFCADRVCCSSRCGEVCFSCNLAGSGGACKPVPSAGDPRNQCPAEAPSTCGRAGGCNGSGACRLHAPGTVCSATTCSGLSETPARSCDGLGVCRAPGALRDCSPYLCSGSACGGTCASSTTCAPGNSCQGTSCAPSVGLALFWRFEESAGTTANENEGGEAAGRGEHGENVEASVLGRERRARSFKLANGQAVRSAGRQGRAASARLCTRNRRFLIDHPK